VVEKIRIFLDEIPGEFGNMIFPNAMSPLATNNMFSRYSCIL
jgi:hypothetical protein